MTTPNRPFWSRLTQALTGPADAVDAPHLGAAPGRGLSSAMRPLALEQRFMFDGAAVGTAMDAGHATSDTGAADASTAAVADSATALRHALSTGAENSLSTAAVAPQRQEVVFVDAHVTDIANLLAGLSSQTEVVMLDASQDGFQQMADYLQGRSGLDAVHLISHGADGTVQAGNIWLNIANLAAHSAALQSIGAALGTDGDLMLYGCYVGESDIGREFLDQMAAITGADVAGSVDATGAASLGGNWTLEHRSGVVETAALAVDTYVSETLSTAPQLVSTTPADDSMAVMPNANITLTFDQAVSKGSGDISIVRTSDNTVQTIPVSSIAVTGSGTTWTITPGNLAAGEAYAVRIEAGTFINASNQNYVGIQDNTTLNFTVAAAAAPVIANLNGDSISYTESSSGVLIDAGANATVTDTDSTNFNGGKVTVSISNNGVPSEDVLSISGQDAGATNITVSGSNVTYGNDLIGTYTGGTLGDPLVISLNSAATPVAVSALLQSLAYRNSNDADIATPTRTVQVTVSDGAGGTSDAASVAVAIIAVNDAPTLTAIATNPTFIENGTGSQLFSGAAISTIEAGQSITELTVQVSNLANGNLEKLIIDGTAVSLINQTPVTTSTNGLSVVVAVSGTTATVTITHAGIPTVLAQTIVNGLAYRNDSEAPTGASRTVSLTGVRDSGGTSNGGIDTGTLSIASTVTVISVNDAPTLSGGPFNLPGTDEGTTSAGTPIRTVLAGLTYSDPDSSSIGGAAITATTGNGIWQYSTDGTTWTNFGAVSNSSALLLNASTQVRYSPDGANGETASLTLRGWDQTTGFASVNGTPRLADASSNGGSTGFSVGTAQAILAVDSVNDAPVMAGVTPTLGGLTDTSTSNSGAQVSDLLAGVTDVDTGALNGMAITDLTAAYGKWQYSTNAGSTWSDVGSVSVTTALILTAQNMVRFVPDGIHGETATITYKAWDQTGTTFGLQGTKTDTTTSGGTSAFSSVTDTASVVVTAVNDAPVVTVSGGSASWTEGNNVASIPVPVDAGLTLSDPDGPNPTSAAARMLTYYNAQDSLSFVNDGLTMGNIVGTWVPGTGILTLTSAGNTATTAEFQAAMRAVTYNNASNSPNSTTRTVQFIVTDGSSAQSTAVTRDVTITAVNDSPTISAVASLPITEDTQTALGQITFSDVDTTLGVATFSVGSGSLSATDAGGVTVGGSATALTLSGTLSNINNFIAANRLLYTPAANASGDVTLTININTTSVSDATTTVTLQVAAVNDAPVITAPAFITVTEDVSSVISGFSFTDVDAGINAVTATFSVPSGTLSATSGVGVTVAGSDTGELTLSGSLADINAFISSNSLTFKTAQDATASVVLTVTLNDRGFSGSGGEQTDTKTVTLNVTAVNDAPVNNVPGAQTTSQNVALGFNTANGNAISISDVDSGNGLMTVTLTAVNGTLSLGSLSGITLLRGTGTNDASMMFEGNRANINAALQTLSFKSGSSFLGAASLTIVTNDNDNDNGNSGTGGAKTDVDTISINVLPVNPKVTSVSAQGIDRTVKIGDEVLISMTWDQAVNVDLSSGRPTLLLETGLVDRNAVYVSGSGSNTLTFKYTVQAGDISADLDFQSTAALQMNGAVISNNTSDLAVPTLPTVGDADSLGGRSNIVVDGVAPVVASVSAPSDGTYIVGQNLDFTVNFSEAMTVNTSSGTPRIAVTLDTGGTVYANYVRGSGSSALVFRMTVASGQLDSTGITLFSSIDTNGGAITDLAGNATMTTLNNVAALGDVKVDGVVPTVLSVEVPRDGSYKAGSVQRFTVNVSEAVQIGSLAPRLVLDVGGVKRYATYVSGSGSAALVFQYVVQAGDNDGNGITVSSLDLRGEQLTNLAGNHLNLLLNGLGSTAGILVDTTAPTAGFTNVALSADTGASGSDFITNTAAQTITATLSEALAAGDSVYGSLDNGANWSDITSMVSGTTLRWSGVTLAGSNTLQLRVTDAAGNDGMVYTQAYVYDTTAPTAGLTNVALSADTGASGSDFITNTAAQTITATLSEALAAGDSVYGSLDNGATWRDITSMVSGTTLSWSGVTLAGSNTLQLRISDVAGNHGAVYSHTYTIDAAAPSTPATPMFDSGSGVSNSDQITNDTTPTLRGTAEDGSTVTIYDGGTLLGTVVATGGNWSYTSSALADGVHRLSVTATDVAGNVSAMSAALDLTIDTVAPSAPTLQLERHGTSAATVHVSGLEAQGQWQYSLNGGSTWMVGQGTTLGLQAAGNYDVQVRQLDAAGNVSQLSSLTVELKAVNPPPESIPQPGPNPVPGSMTELPTEPVVLPAELGQDAAFTLSWPTQGILGATSSDVLSATALSSPLALALAGLSDLGTPVWSAGELHMQADTADVPYQPQFVSATLAGQGALQLLRSVDALLLDERGQLHWQVPSDMFGHVNPLAVVGLSLTLADGQRLPEWVRFDAHTGKLQAQMPANFRGELVLRLTARDSLGREVSTLIKLKPAVAEGAVAEARAGVGEQFQRAAQQRTGQMAGQRLHA